MRSGPDYAQDTRTVLRAELGLDDAELDRLEQQGIIVSASVNQSKPVEK